MNEPLTKLKFDTRRTIAAKFCPCGKSNKDGKFCPYVGYEDKGYCHSCDTTFLPETGNKSLFTPQTRYTPKPIIPIDYLPLETYHKQLVNFSHLYSRNHFIQWLEKVHNEATVKHLIEKYLLGNSGNAKYNGWVLFPYLNIEGNLCNIKAMDYNPINGKRVKEPYSKIAFLGKDILKNTEANLVLSFFGEHLLKGNLKDVYLFESEATAIYVAPFYQDKICLATGGKNGCKWFFEKEKCDVLIGRKVTLFPDLDAHNEWSDKAQILIAYGIHVTVSNLIVETCKGIATSHNIEFSDLVKQKYDLRDVLLLCNPKPEPIATPETIAPIATLEIIESLKLIPNSYFINLRKPTAMELFFGYFKASIQPNNDICHF